MRLEEAGLERQVLDRRPVLDHDISGKADHLSISSWKLCSENRLLLLGSVS